MPTVQTNASTAKDENPHQQTDDPRSEMEEKGNITNIDGAAIHELQVGSEDQEILYGTFSDGTRLILTKFKGDSTPAEQTKDVATLDLEEWSLDPRNKPSLKAQRSKNCTFSTPERATYSTPSLHKSANLSSPHFFERADPVAVSNNLQSVRVGPHVLSTGLPESGTVSDDRIASAQETGPYWEEMACRGQYIVLCCRRTPRKESKYQGTVESVKPEDIFLDDELDKLSSVDGSEIALSQSSKAEDAQSQTSIDFDGNASAAEGSLAFSDEDNLSDMSHVALSTTDQSSNASIFSDDEACKSEAGESENPGFEDEALGQPSDDDLAFEGEDSSSDNDSDNVAGYCDLCYKDIVFHYRCPECNDGNFDICSGCFKAGKWCYDTKHELIGYEDWVQPDGESFYHDDLTLAQEIVAFDQSSGEKTPVFRFHRKSETLMHKSPPVIHPFEPLVIWPLTQGQLLFGNLVDNSSFVHNIRPSSTRTYTLSTHLHLPPNRTPNPNLHLLTLETPTADAQKRRKCLPQNPETSTRKIPLSVRTSTYRLPPDPKKSKSAPTLLHTKTVPIGPCTQLAVARMLFAVTWTAKDVFVAFNDAGALKLYKISLPAAAAVASDENSSSAADEQKQLSAEVAVCVPRNKVLLPKSAEERTVQFFPGAGGEGDCSVLVVHGRFGKGGAAPCVVYLDEQDLGGWVDVGDV